MSERFKDRSSKGTSFHKEPRIEYKSRTAHLTTRPGDKPHSAYSYITEDGVSAHAPTTIHKSGLAPKRNYYTNRDHELERERLMRVKEAEHYFLQYGEQTGANIADPTRLKINPHAYSHNDAVFDYQPVPHTDPPKVWVNQGEFKPLPYGEADMQDFNYSNGSDYYKPKRVFVSANDRVDTVHVMNKDKQQPIWDSGHYREQSLDATVHISPTQAKNKRKSQPYFRPTAYASGDLDLTVLQEASLENAYYDFSTTQRPNTMIRHAKQQFIDDETTFWPINNTHKQHEDAVYLGRSRAQSVPTNAHAGLIENGVPHWESEHLDTTPFNGRTPIITGHNRYAHNHGERTGTLEDKGVRAFSSAHFDGGIPLHHFESSKLVHSYQLGKAQPVFNAEQNHHVRDRYTEVDNFDAHEKPKIHISQRKVRARMG